MRDSGLPAGRMSPGSCDDGETELSLLHSHDSTSHAQSTEEKCPEMSAMALAGRCRPIRPPDFGSRDLYPISPGDRRDTKRQLRKIRHKALSRKDRRVPEILIDSAGASDSGAEMPSFCGYDGIPADDVPELRVQ